ncbi:hypothetical protein BRADI_4g35611v3 [Brachypodium distachyon]|uniref:Uncharacterized protein n=1 Tax=Brachypodium distachyon TaxID=15368 RepID=A0A0Q3HRZ2_BRADI|nr:hypothetical protein BRADI_4g35611v3 [Brachypodium distachyon]
MPGVASSKFEPSAEEECSPEMGYPVARPREAGLHPTVVCCGGGPMVSRSSSPSTKSRPVRYSSARPGVRRGRRRLHEQPLREVRVVHAQVHFVGHVELEHVAAHCNRRLKHSSGTRTERRRRAGIIHRSHRRDGDVGPNVGDGNVVSLLALEVSDGGEGGALDVVKASVCGRWCHGEEPRGVWEIEKAFGGSGGAAQREHGRVVGSASRLGGEVRPEPEPLVAHAGHAHLAHPSAGAASAAHSTVHRVARLLELGAPRWALRRRRPNHAVLVVRGRRGSGADPLIGAVHGHEVLGCC